MKLSSVDPEELLKIATALETDQTYNFNAIDISFWKDGKEIEPSVPVKVVWKSGSIEASEDQLVHLKDDGSVEKMEGARITANKVVFEADTFSTYITTRLDTFSPGTKVEFEDMNGTALTPTPATMSSGELASSHPDFPGYTYYRTIYKKNGRPYDSDPVIYLGAFIYNGLDDDGNPVEKTFIYYRTASTASDSDLIVELAEDETIHLQYKPTPLTVKYQVIYNGTTYTLNGTELPDNLKTALGSDASQLEVNGPVSAEQRTPVPEAITVDIPRGYQATVRIGNSQLGNLGAEPDYSVSSDNKTIIKNSTEYDLSGVYDFPSVNSNQTITINLTKRNSYTFNARFFLATVYAGGEGNTTGTLGDRRINSGRAKTRIT